MISIAVRMVGCDLLFAIGVLVVLGAGGFRESLTPVTVLGLVAAAVGLVGSAWMTVSLIRYTREQRRNQEQLLAAGDRDRFAQGRDRREW